MNPNLTADDLNHFELAHNVGRGGESHGWVMVEDIDEEYCRLGMGGPAPELGQAFLAAKDLLSVDVRTRKADVVGEPDIIDRIRIGETSMPPLVALRADIKSGVVKIVQTHFVREAKS